MLTLVNATSALDIGFAIYFPPLAFLKKAMENGVEIDVYFYEELIQYPDKSFAEILKTLQLYSWENLNRALTNLATDSQAETDISRKAVARVLDARKTIDKDTKDRYNLICKNAGLNDLFRN